MICIIAAIDRNRALGYRNRLLFHLPDDLRNFKVLTQGHTVIMGHNTFRSLPHGALPKRRNIVITRSTEVQYPGVEICHSLGEALRMVGPEETAFVMGGAGVYRQALPYADRLYLTEIDAEAPQADVYFPELTPDEWVEEERIHHDADERHAHPFDIVTYKRKSAERHSGD